MATAPCDWNINVGCCDGWDDYDPDVQQRATANACLIMWAATGRRFGLCEITVQPCNPTPAEPLYVTYPVGGAAGYRSGGFTAGSPLADGGGCGGHCSCRASCETRLDGPVDSIVEVLVGGDVVDPAAYRVLDHRALVRIDGNCWPSRAGYSRQNPPGFEVKYRRGEPVPEAVENAAGTLACELAKACVPGSECRLPQRLASLSRQGVELQVADVTTYLDHMLTGIAEVDQIIAAINPHRQHARPQVLSPDLPSPRQVTG